MSSIEIEDLPIVDMQQRSHRELEDMLKIENCKFKFKRP